ncbi:MAG: tRNA1(Val) (adenine(37)-N6)-methyltransferase [Thermodesulfobacteriota bacterium]
MTEYTKNNFFDGCVTVYQNKNGYRFSIDSILLAHHITPIKKCKIVDIGTGSAIIPVSVIYKNQTSDLQIYGVEIQKSLFKLAKKNIAVNGFEDKAIILNRDINDITQKDINGPADIIVSNPPYQKPGSGRINPASEKAAARHELKLDLKSLLTKTKSLLKNKGRFYIIYPAYRASELIFEMEKFKIPPKKIRFIHSYDSSEAVMVICEGLANGNNGVKILPPLIIYKEENVYTDEVLNMLR